MEVQRLLRIADAIMMSARVRTSMRAIESFFLAHSLVPFSVLVLKRGVEPCRLTGMGSGLPIRIRIQTRKVAYTLGTPKDCRPQTRKAAALCSYGSPIVKVDHEVSPTVKTKCDMVIKPVKSARANDKVSAFRKELAETCERVRALRSRLTRLEETKRRSEAVQRKALEQQDRLRSVFEALIEAEKEKLLRDNSRFGRT